MWVIKLLVQIVTGFGLLIFGVKHMDEWSDSSLWWVLFYWISYIIINIIVAIWRMQDPGYDAKSDIEHAFKIAKKCPCCMKKLPSYFTSKCPYCTADLT
jgi:hypothetical protein